MQKIFLNSGIDGCLSMLLGKNILSPKIQELLEDMPIEFYEKAKELVKDGDDNPNLRLNEGLFMEIEDSIFIWDFSYDEETFSITKSESKNDGLWKSLMIYAPDTVLEEILELEDREDETAFANYEEMLENQNLDNGMDIVLGEEFEIAVILK